MEKRSVKKGDKYVLLEDFLNIPKGAVVVINEDDAYGVATNMTTVIFNNSTEVKISTQKEEMFELDKQHLISKIISEIFTEGES